MFDNFDMSAPLGEKLTFGLQVGGFGILVVFLLLIILAVCIMILSKIVRAGENLSFKGDNGAVADTAPSAAPAPAAAPAAALPATQSAGSLDLVDVDEPTAAVIMAIVSNESGIPLNRLMFKSIKKVD